MKIYIAGRITGDPDFKEKFKAVEEHLKTEGHKIMNPATLPDGFEYEDYMKVCFGMIDACQMVYLLKDYKESAGALREEHYASARGKIIRYQEELDKGNIDKAVEIAEYPCGICFNDPELCYTPCDFEPKHWLKRQIGAR